MSMDEEKRQRVLNAAMDEFSKGYDAASTDAMVKEAGISKGLLFHYFGTKRGLYVFLIDYALDVLVHEFADLINLAQGDLLDRLWQMSLLKRDLCFQHPKIFEFITVAYYATKEAPGGDFAVRFRRIQDEAYRALYGNIDQSLLREGIDKVMASNVIRWTLEGLAEKRKEEARPFQEMAAEYDVYLDETKQYLGLLRQMLYRQ